MPTLVDRSQPHAPAKPVFAICCCYCCCEKKRMYKIDEQEFANLELAMAYAKLVDRFVTIVGPNFEVCGRFGVDSVRDGKCPDGITYDWNKASRIGRVKRERV